jgi:hypothetical protein
MNAKIKNFADYVFSFYGKDGIYDMGATREQIMFATGMIFSRQGQRFHGDSIDRENASRILEEYFGLVHP